MSRDAEQRTEEPLSTKLTAEMKQEFRVAAAEAGTTMSDFLRTLVEAYLEARDEQFSAGEAVWDTDKEKAALIIEDHGPDERGDVSIAYLDSIRKYEDLEWVIYPHGELKDEKSLSTYNRNTDDLKRF